MVKLTHLFLSGDNAEEIIFITPVPFVVLFFFGAQGWLKLVFGLLEQSSRSFDRVLGVKSIARSR